jgi:hypothetical protein
MLPITTSYLMPKSPKVCAVALPIAQHVLHSARYPSFYNGSQVIEFFRQVATSRSRTFHIQRLRRYGRNIFFCLNRVLSTSQ